MNIITFSNKVVMFCLITVISASSYASVGDITLESKAKLVLILKKGIPTAEIITHADKSRLQIAGYVSNAEELRQVENAIREYLDQEKYQVINNVKILAIHNRASDKLILERNVKQHFAQENFPLTNISIQAKYNSVMLSGFVDESVDIAKTTNIAKRVPDISNVDNCLLRKEK